MKSTSISLVTLTVFSCFYFTRSKIQEIPIPEELQQCYNRVERLGVDEFVGSIYNWFCEHTLLNAQFFTDMPPMNTETEQYVQQLIDTSGIKSTNRSNSRMRRQANGGPCVRKEYRMLSLNERRRYHNAVNALKRDTSVAPNRHDAIGNIHTGATNVLAHGGPGFFGWHRIYLWLYESALRQVDPSVCLPYWDSTLDNELTNPLRSSLWTENYIGTPRGPVVSGPFAGWRIPGGGQLIRNVGVDGQLLNPDDIQSVMTRSSYAEIVTSNATNTPFNLEVIHGGPHIYVGGTMSQLSTAAFDPLFYLHHAFVDYIFESFRERLRSIGVNPEIYPQVNTNSRHEATAPTNFGRLTQATGYLESLGRVATYEPVPSCSADSPSCGNRFLVCQVRTGRCIPRRGAVRVKRSMDEQSESYLGQSDQDQDPSESEMQESQNDQGRGDSGQNSRERDSEISESTTCDKEPHYGQPYQNDYCVNKACDTSQWAMIPVRIVNTRPPKFHTYNSYPVWSGTVDKNIDIYAPAAYNQTKKYITNVQGNPLPYRRCKKDEPAGQIFLYSHGMNYAGYYKESTIVDQKLPVSVSMGYIGVKKPSSRKGEVIKVLLRAHDSCGRVCQVACKDPYTNEFKICSGAVAVNSEKPLMFGFTVADAVTNVFDYEFDSEAPRVQTDNVFITFYCDYRDKFPFVKTRSSLVTIHKW